MPEIGDKWDEQVDSKYKLKSNEVIEWKIKGWVEEWYNNQNIIDDEDYWQKTNWNRRKAYGADQSD